ncbi:MAG: hypothetical protein H6907_10125 [Hyphomicrobiales bacterium]|nr:hypothetical protein [Hyphomicrobiales bacterium]MCP5372075.1 hypothetical protein [Hyphomicrobiales bacterium]
MDLQAARRIQFWVLVAISAFILWGAPDHWRLTPDGGIYLGTAENMVAHGTYTFNGHPNLLYYPGTSSIIAVLVAPFGANAMVVHLAFAAIVVAILWLCRAYFSEQRYGWVGIVLPVAVACASVVRYQAVHVLSDGPFLALSLVALLCWRQWEEAADRRYLWACVAAVAMLPLVRFHGLFAIAALGLGLLVDWWRRWRMDGRAFLRMVAIGLVVVAPFALWTWRNYVLYTPDTHNMALQYFFGLKSLLLDARRYAAADWIDARWKYAVYANLYQLMDLTNTLFGPEINRVLPKFVLPVVFPLVCLAGAWRYLKRASAMEIAYVAISVGFILYLKLKANSLYTVERHWLLTLPFIIAAAGLGMAFLHDLAGRVRAQGVVRAVAVAGCVLIASHGVSGWLPEVSRAANARDVETSRLYRNLADYVDTSLPVDSRLLTSDWGIIPRFIHRTSFPPLRGDAFRQTFQRIDKYGLSYAVWTNVSSGLVAPSMLRMTELFPHLFTLVHEVATVPDGPEARIFAIDLAGVRRTLKERTDQF